MNTGVVSRRFAKALLAYAKDEGQEDKVYEEVRTLAAHFVEVPGLRHAIENPILEKKKKVELLCEASGGKTVSKSAHALLQSGAGGETGKVLAVHDVVVHRPLSGGQKHSHR